MLNQTDLNSPRGFGGAPADVEEARAAGLALARLTGCPAQVHHQRVSFKHAHKVRGFLSLRDADLPRQKQLSQQI